MIEIWKLGFFIWLLLKLRLFYPIIFSAKKFSRKLYTSTKYSWSLSLKTYSLKPMRKALVIKFKVKLFRFESTKWSVCYSVYSTISGEKTKEYIEEIIHQDLSCNLTTSAITNFYLKEWLQLRLSVVDFWVHVWPKS